MPRLFFPLVFLPLAGMAAATPPEIRLPTANQHLFTGEPEQFYMYVDRNFEGQVSKPWQAGGYGFVRTAIRVNGEVLLTHFHEGIDISPVKRDAAGNPLDLVTSIAAGRVAYTSPVAGHSNYGKYVVVEHPWEGSAVVSLYAHLSEIACKPGDVVEPGTVLGKMGFTGAGIDRTRAHCHLELGMLLSARYDEWHRTNVGGTNYHGIYNGQNIAGAEVPRFFLERQADPERTFGGFVAATPVHFKVTVPSRGSAPDFVKRYPWISHAPAEGAVSWEIAFSATGLPVAIEPSQREVATAVVTSVRPSTVPQRYLTRGLITGEGNRATLTQAGNNLVSLLTDDFPAPPGPRNLPPSP